MSPVGPGDAEAGPRAGRPAGRRRLSLRFGRASGTASLAALLADTAWAQQADGGNALFTFAPLIVIFVLFYFLLIRPQTKKQKEHRAMVEGLGTGDEIVTGGGVLGKVTELGPDFVTVEIADKVAIKVRRHTIAAVMPKGTMRSV